MLIFSLRRKPSLASIQRGVTLVESLVSLLILALGVLGLLAVQLRLMVNNQNANYSATAARLAENLFERVRANPKANQNLNPGFSATDPLNAAQWGWLANYAAAWGNPPNASENCEILYCDADQRAQWDISRWKQMVSQSLPLGNAQVFVSPDNPRQLIAILGWRANEQGTAPPLPDLGDNVELPAACGTSEASVQTHSCYFSYGQP